MEDRNISLFIGDETDLLIWCFILIRKIDSLLELSEGEEIVKEVRCDVRDNERERERREDCKHGYDDID